MGTLLTFPGRPLPLVPPAKESAAAVLLPVSAWSVVVGVGEPPAEPLVPEPVPDGPGEVGVVPDDPVEVGAKCCGPPPHARQNIARKMIMTTENAGEGRRQTMGLLGIAGHVSGGESSVTTVGD